MPTEAWQRIGVPFPGTISLLTAAPSPGPLNDRISYHYQLRNRIILPRHTRNQGSLGFAHSSLNFFYGYAPGCKARCSSQSETVISKAFIYKDACCLQYFYIKGTSHITSFYISKGWDQVGRVSDAEEVRQERTYRRRADHTERRLSPSAGNVNTGTRRGVEVAAS